MNFTLRQFQVFESVARHGSFTRAAAELHLTQPAVSMHIKQFESVLGLPLFEQLGKRIFLTASGEELLAYSRRLTELLSEMEDVVEEIKGLRRGRLAVSVATTANHFATRMLADFARLNVGLLLRLDVANRESLLRQLENNECDLVIMGLPPQIESLAAEPFLRNPLVVISSPRHPLVGKESISVERIANETFLMREEGSGTRAATLKFFEGHGIQLKLGMELRSSEALKQVVEAGLGLAVVSLHTLEVELASSRLAILDVQGFPIERHWYLVQRFDKRLSGVAQTFRKFVLDKAESYVSFRGLR